MIQTGSNDLRNSTRTLTAYTVPRTIVAVDDLPKSLIRTVLRRQVREAMLASGG